MYSRYDALVRDLPDSAKQSIEDSDIEFQKISGLRLISILERKGVPIKSIERDNFGYIDFLLPEGAILQYHGRVGFSVRGVDERGEHLHLEKGRAFDPESAINIYLEQAVRETRSSLFESTRQREAHAFLERQRKAREARVIAEFENLPEPFKEGIKAFLAYYALSEEREKIAGQKSMPEIATMLLNRIDRVRDHGILDFQDIEFTEKKD